MLSKQDWTAWTMTEVVDAFQSEVYVWSLIPAGGQRCRSQRGALFNYQQAFVWSARTQPSMSHLPLDFIPTLHLCMMTHVVILIRTDAIRFSNSIAMATTNLLSEWHWTSCFLQLL